MSYRVIQWATGGIGSECLRIILSRPDLELAGVLVYIPEKAGRDVGELLGGKPVGVVTTANKHEIMALKADCVLHTPLQHRDMAEHNADVEGLLRSGKNVLSTIDYFHPATVGPAWAERFERACRSGQSTLMGLGNQPGFVCERLVTTITSMCSHIKHIHVIERMDCSNITPVNYAVMGFGMTPDEFARARVVEMWDHMYRQVAGAVAAILGATPDRIETGTRTVLAAKTLTHTKAPVPAGTVAGTAFSWTAIVRGEPFFTLETRWVCDPDMPGWEAPNDWLVIVEGRPSLRLTFERAHSYAGGVRRGGSVHETDLNYYECSYRSAAALLTNAIPGVVAAPAGHFLAPVFAPYRDRRI